MTDIAKRLHRLADRLFDVCESIDVGQVQYELREIAKELEAPIHPPDTAVTPDAAAEAARVIRANWPPPERYTMLREALTVALKALEGRSAGDTPNHA